MLECKVPIHFFSSLWISEFTPVKVVLKLKLFVFRSDSTCKSECQQGFRVFHSCLIYYITEVEMGTKQDYTEIRCNHLVIRGRNSS